VGVATGSHPDPSCPRCSSASWSSTSCGAAIAAIDGLVAQLPPGFTDRADLPYAGRPWTVAHATYRQLLESEYAAWVAAFGFRVNHFTVDVGRLATFAELRRGQRVPARRTASSSTAPAGSSRARPPITSSSRRPAPSRSRSTFADGTFAVPSCYYEFARRYQLPSGERFQGFVPASADKLFHSTDVRR
jgi:hypothetical protein